MSPTLDQLERAEELSELYTVGVPPRTAPDGELTIDLISDGILLERRQLDAAGHTTATYTYRGEHGA